MCPIFADGLQTEVGVPEGLRKCRELGQTLWSLAWAAQHIQGVVLEPEECHAVLRRGCNWLRETHQAKDLFRGVSS